MSMLAMATDQLGLFKAIMPTNLRSKLFEMADRPTGFFVVGAGVFMWNFMFSMTTIFSHYMSAC